MRAEVVAPPHRKAAIGFDRSIYSDINDSDALQLL